MSRKTTAECCYQPALDTLEPNFPRGGFERCGAKLVNATDIYSIHLKFSRMAATPPILAAAGAGDLTALVAALGDFAAEESAQNACDSDGKSALHYAAAEGQLSVVELLVGEKAWPIDGRTKKGVYSGCQSITV